MPLTRNDCSFLANTIKENQLADYNATDQDLAYWFKLAHRFQESADTGIITD